MPIYFHSLIMGISPMLLSPLLSFFLTTPRLPLGFHRNSPSVLFSSSMCWSGLDAVKKRPWQKENSLYSSFSCFTIPRPQVLISFVWWKMGPAPVHISANGKRKKQEQRASIFLLSKFHCHLHFISEELFNWLCLNVNYLKGFAAWHVLLTNKTWL